jgi:dTDP-4-dehydrorhamnose reductase
MQPSPVDVDLRSPEAVRTVARDTDPEIIIHGAAFTRVDDAEVETDAASATNADAPQLLTEESWCTALRSSRAKQPCRVPIRTPASWVYSGGGVPSVAIAVRVLTSGTSMRVVDDQVSTPRRAAHLAAFLLRLVDQPDVSGLQHSTDAGVASSYDVVVHCVAEMFRQRGKLGDDVGVSPVDSTVCTKPAARPRLSLVDRPATWNKTRYMPIHWRDGVVASTHELMHA